MAIEIIPLTEEDIPGTIECIQQAFADDPYFNWVFDSSKVCIGGPSGTPVVLMRTDLSLWGVTNYRSELNHSLKGVKWVESNARPFSR